jgi:hypothetical protein
MIKTKDRVQRVKEAAYMSLAKWNERHFRLFFHSATRLNSFEVTQSENLKGQRSGALNKWEV